jgi:cytochrome P450
MVVNQPWEVKLKDGATYRVPVGNLVVPASGLISRDEDVWTNPEEYDPDRFAPPRSEHKKASNAFATFSGGTSHFYIIIDPVLRVHSF